MPATTLHLAPTAPRRRPAAPAVAGALLVGAALAGCTTPDDKFPPACPALSLVRDAGTITLFAAAGRDPSEMVLQARITAVPAKCETDPDSAKSVRATLHIEATATRGSAAGTVTPQATYFVAVAEGDHVLQEQDFPFVPQFRANTDTVSLTGDDIELLVPVSKSKSAAAYHIYIGFRLTPDELAFNRSHPMP